MRSLTSPAGTPPQPRHAQARREITAEVGTAVIAEWHQASRARDLWWAFWPPVAVVAVAAAIGATDWWPAQLVLMALQGFLIVNCAIVAHSLSSHRRPFGKRFARWHGTVLSAVAMRSGTIYTVSHQHHHRALGTPEDQDPELSDLDRSWKRAVAALGPGFLLVNARALVNRADRARTWHVRKWCKARLVARPADKRIVRAEAICVAGLFTAVGFAAWQWPAAVGRGYLVPLAVFAPIAHAIREAAEHFDLDLDNPYELATPYEPGWFLRAFAHQTGTIHLVHHLWPNLPHYRCAAVWREIQPIVERNGVTIRRSYWRILVDYFLADKPRLWYRRADGTRVDVRTLNAFGDPNLAAERS